VRFENSEVRRNCRASVIGQVDMKRFVALAALIIAFVPLAASADPIRISGGPVSGSELIGGVFKPAAPMSEEQRVG
jgi:hypothetical protein